VQACSITSINVLTIMLNESKVSTAFLTTHMLLPCISKNLENLKYCKARGVCSSQVGRVCASLLVFSGHLRYVRVLLSFLPINKICRRVILLNKEMFRCQFHEGSLFNVEMLHNSIFVIKDISKQKFEL
jgi:hypothetical protein